MTRIRSERIGLAIVAGLLLLAATSSRAAGGPGASGAGHIPSASFVFSAVAHADSSASGELEYHRLTHAGTERYHIEFDCIEVSGNIAWMTGTIRHTTSDVEVGSGVALTIEDNVGAADRVGIKISRGTIPRCDVLHSIETTEDLNRGNVTIHDGA